MDIQKISDELGENRYERLKALMAALRDKENGCPWDIEQDFTSISRYTLEEAYEVVDAIERKDMPALKEELGDLLLQVLFHSQMADEDGDFSLDEVADGILHKMIRRHPHVFGDDTIENAEAQTENWEAVKAAERAAKGIAEKPTSVLDGVAGALPALTRAEKLQKRAARVGFDWPESGPVIDKLIEEAEEIKAAQTDTEREEEIGDFLFAAVNMARHYGIDPEMALKAANAKFTRRFHGVEDLARQDKRDLAQMSLDEMEALWRRVKLSEKQD